MDRATFLRIKRQAAEERMDTLWAPEYDEHWGEIFSSHRTMLEKFLARCEPGGLILDAACGTGKYWQMILDSGRSVFGIDQSQQMLNQAHAKFPHVAYEKLGLQEMAFRERFDGIICMDAMENVFPEDWSTVLNNFHRALKPQAPLYFTVELAAATDVRAAVEAGRARELPVVDGEMAHQGGYHFYPEIEQVKHWTRAAGFKVLEEASGDEYYHLIASKTNQE